MIRTAVAVLLAVALPTLTQPKFTSTRTEVLLAVTVTDGRGQFVADLQKGDFTILDEGRPQRISYFSHDTPGARQPTVIGFLVDRSAASRSHWDKFKELTKELIWELLPDDPAFKGYLISYGAQEQLETGATSDPSKLADQVDRLQPGGGSSLYNAIHLACRDRRLATVEAPKPRHILVIIGDGHDNASDYTLDQVIELALRNHVTVYAVSTTAFEASNNSSADLERLAKETGGEVKYPLNNPYSKVPGLLSQPSDFGNYALPVNSGGYASAIASAISDSVQSLKTEIASQYILRYVPEIDPSTAYKDRRRIEVRVRSLPWRFVTVRTRKSYFPHPAGQ